MNNASDTFLQQKYKHLYFRDVTAEGGDEVRRIVDIEWKPRVRTTMAAYHAVTQLHSRNGLEVSYQQDDDNEAYAINDSLHEMLKLSEDINRNYSFEQLPVAPTYNPPPVPAGGHEM